LRDRCQKKIDFARFKNKAKLKDRYERQIKRLSDSGFETMFVEQAVEEAVSNLATAKKSSLVVYGDPQSGKTEMMICLTARLLDKGHSTVVHLMNDSVDLLSQNLKRFKAAGLAPAPRGLWELLLSSDTQNPLELIVFCKKNPHDLEKLMERLEKRKRVVVVDDEADYASPNAKINRGDKTRINRLVGELIGKDGYYVGVTATPARLDLNTTFDNDAEKWVYFKPHSKYTGQEVFFPVDRKEKLSYRLVLLDQAGTSEEARDALARFLVTSAFLNCYENKSEDNYTMLVHTSGKKQDHENDRLTVESAVHALIDSEGKEFKVLVGKVHEAANKLYPEADADVLTDYVVANASRATLTVLNSERDRKALGDNPTVPTSPFTIIVGGNIVSRGVTFPNLLSLFFTRTVKQRLQQDTYIQRARMFGARGKYLRHFELTIPAQLYTDWHSCFVFHRLALETIKSNLGSPVWIGDRRVSVAADASINKATVTFNKREMAFGMFNFSDDLDDLVHKDQVSVETLKKLRAKIGGDALPMFLIEYIQAMLKSKAGTLAIHTASTIEGYGASANKGTISREKGFIGKSQRESKRFPDAVHHIKILFNKAGKARLFYKAGNNLQFMQNR
jgi:GTPase SAR1 family protein